MSGLELLVRIASRGVILYADGDELVIEEQTGTILPDEWQELRASKDEILDHLRSTDERILSRARILIERNNAAGSDGSATSEQDSILVAGACPICGAPTGWTEFSQLHCTHCALAAIVVSNRSNDGFDVLRRRLRHEIPDAEQPGRSNIA